MQWLEGLKSALPATCDFNVGGENVSIFLDASMIKAAARRVYKEEYFLEDLTCLDVEEGYLVLYHFAHFDNPGRITVRVVVPHDNSEIPSIADIYQGAEWHERECMDYYPVIFKNNPNMANLLLPDGMEEKPLVKTDKVRTSMLDFFAFTELGEAQGDNPMTAALEARVVEMKQAEEKAVAEVEAKAAEEAKAAQEAAAAEGEEEKADA